MRIITQEEKHALMPKRGKTSYLRLQIENLNPGEILQVDRADCPGKRGPYYIVVRLNNGKRKYVLSKITKGTGWIIERIT
ncbi:MAG: hypothetical protein H7Y00_03095 [Fimbriimonadaceae bacterium]|nr:hypothetical protein [Chitinophagales bacterium]